MSYKALSFGEMYEDLMEHQKNITEAIDASKIIDELIDTSFGGSNESQMKAVQLLKGLATSDDPASNAFMKKLDAWTSGLKKSESIKSDLDKLGADSMKRDGKLITLTWKEEGKVTKADVEKAVGGGKVKFVGVTSKNGKTVAEIQMEKASSFSKSALMPMVKKLTALGASENNVEIINSLSKIKKSINDLIKKI